MMASDSGIDSHSSPELEEAPMSRTHQYRHHIKPLLERKRRARINKCVDELKELMVAALHKDGESITKLEKADVLELTVRHLRKLKVEGRLGLRPGSSERFRAGYTFCAGEISRYLTSTSTSTSSSSPHGPGLDLSLAARLLQHLSVCLRNMETLPVCPPPPPPPLLSPSDLISHSRLEALRFSLGHSVGPPDLGLPLVATDREDDKAWRPW